MSVRPLIPLCLPAARVACELDGEGGPKADALEAGALGGGAGGAPGVDSGGTSVDDGETWGDGGSPWGDLDGSTDIAGWATVSVSDLSADWTWEGTRSSWCPACEVSWDAEFSWEGGDFGADFRAGVAVYTDYYSYLIDSDYNIWGLAELGGGYVVWNGSLLYYYGYIPYRYTGYGRY